jgi:regulator of sigma E protease
MILLYSLIIIIILHEAAHLIVAKKCGCGVLRYSIGFGKPILFSQKIRGTIYQITPWILGGFCELEGELIKTTSKSAFVNLSYRKKLAVSIAGCAINILSGGLAMYFGIRFNIYYLY